MECDSKKDTQCTTEISRRKSKERSDCRKALSEGREYIVPDDIKIKNETSPETNNTSSEEMLGDDTPAPETVDVPTAHDIVDTSPKEELSTNVTRGIEEELHESSEINEKSNQDNKNFTDG